MKSRMGWIPDLPDFRDQWVEPSLRGSLPSSCDLRSRLPAIYTQGELGSCTANAIAAAIEYDQALEKTVEYLPSRLFIYYNERQLSGNQNADSGAALRDGMKAINKWGYCQESLWPYDCEKFATKPSDLAYEAGAKDIVFNYARVQQIRSQINQVLASGLVIPFGFSCYSGLQSINVSLTGVLDYPTADQDFIGGHAVVLCGYEDSEDFYWVRNSWGPGWGLKGYFKMAARYVLDPNLAADFWVIKSVPT